MPRFFFIGLGASSLFAATLLGCSREVAPVSWFDAGPAPTPSAAVDLSQCRGCQLLPQLTWSFSGIYRDSSCTVPLAQALVPACAPVPALGSASLVYVDEIGSRKSNDSAQVTLTEAVAPDAVRFRKVASGCVSANEVATNVAPTCTGSKVCRNATGGLVCDGCRTFADGCPEYEDTRAYAAFEDPDLNATKPSGGGSSSGLRACCNALTSEGKRLGASPEGGLLLQAAAQCNGIAAQGAKGVEFAAIKSMLGGRLPSLCSGL